jgi:hypothetical protein
MTDALRALDSRPPPAAEPAPDAPSHTARRTRSAMARMDAVREAFRCRRLAHAQRLLFAFYVEHNLTEEAGRSREALLGHLLQACRLWRRALGNARR